MKREEFQEELRKEVDTLVSHGESVKKLIDDVHATLRNNGDVAFTTMDACKRALSTMTDTRKSLETTSRLLKLRAAARMKEG